MNLDTELNLPIENIVFEFSGNFINITAQLTLNHRFNVTFVASNGGGSASNSVIISK